VVPSRGAQAHGLCAVVAAALLTAWTGAPDVGGGVAIAAWTPGCRDGGWAVPRSTIVVGDDQLMRLSDSVALVEVEHLDPVRYDTPSGDAPRRSSYSSEWDYLGARERMQPMRLRVLRFLGRPPDPVFDRVLTVHFLGTENTIYFDYVPKPLFPPGEGVGERAVVFLRPFPIQSEGRERHWPAFLRSESRRLAAAATPNVVREIVAWYHVRDGHAVPTFTAEQERYTVAQLERLVIDAQQGPPLLPRTGRHGGPPSGAR
jgi:hypothetical protein